MGRALVDGLKGLLEAIDAVCPKADVWSRVVHAASETHLRAIATPVVCGLS